MTIPSPASTLPRSSLRCAFACARLTVAMVSSMTKMLVIDAMLGMRHQASLASTRLEAP